MDVAVVTVELINSSVNVKNTTAENALTDMRGWQGV